MRTIGDSPVLPPLSRRSMLLLLSSLAVGATGLARAGDGPLRVNYYDDFAPYSWLEKDGRVTGILIDALDEVLTRRSGIALTHRALPWARAQHEVKLGLADAFCTLVTDERQAYARFSGTFLVRPGRVVVFARDNPRVDEIRAIRNAEDLKRFVIVTYIGDSRTKTLFKDMQVEVLPDLDRVLMKIAASRSDVSVMPDSVWKFHARRMGLRDLLDQVHFEQQPGYHLGIRKSHPAVGRILAAFDTAVPAARDDGTLARIVDAYG